MGQNGPRLLLLQQLIASLPVPTRLPTTELVELLRGWQRLLWDQPTGDGAAHRAADSVCSIADSPVPPSPPACGWDGCRNSCIAVNAWVLIVLGTLGPLAVLWAVEERSRLRFQRHWLQIHRPSRTAPQRSGGSAGSSMSALSWPMLCLWLLFFAWAVWVALDLTILR